MPQLAGLKVADIQPGMPMHGQVEGVFVVGVDRESAAFKNGLRAGDVVFGVGRARVRSVNQFTDVAARRSSRSASRSCAGTTGSNSSSAEGNRMALYMKKASTRGRDLPMTDADGRRACSSPPATACSTSWAGLK